jgi:hypothetical protein
MQIDEDSMRQPQPALTSARHGYKRPIPFY